HRRAGRRRRTRLCRRPDQGLRVRPARRRGCRAAAILKRGIAALAPCHRANPSATLAGEIVRSNRTGSVMPRILVIHGAGMNMRGKVQTEIFGPMTLPEYDERIRGYASELGLEVEIFHSNIEGEIVNKLYDAADRGID